MVACRGAFRVRKCFLRNGSLKLAAKTKILLEFRRKNGIAKFYLSYGGEDGNFLLELKRSFGDGDSEIINHIVLALQFGAVKNYSEVAQIKTYLRLRSFQQVFPLTAHVAVLQSGHHEHTSRP